MGCYEPAACVDESDHHALMYVWHGQTVRQDRVGEASARIALKIEIDNRWFYSKNR